MFKNNLSKTLSKVASFINEIKTGIEENERHIQSNREAITQIEVDSVLKNNEIINANRLLKTLNG